MKSILIKINGDKEKEFIKIISLQIFKISSPAELGLINVIYKLYGSGTFMLNEAVKAQISHELGGINDNSLKVSISRLIKKKALVKSGKLLGLNTAFKDIKDSEQLVIRVV